MSRSNLLIKSRVNRPGFVDTLYQSKAGLWLRDMLVPRHKNLIYVIEDEETGMKRTMLGSNIVTDAGDIWYAQSAAGETPTNTFNNMYLSSVAFSPTPVKGTDAGDLASTISGSSKAVSATYPKTNDGDADNTGAGTDVVTHLFSYAKADFADSDIEGVTIGTSSTTFGSGSDPILMARNESPSFAKTSNDTLKVFVNHTMNGV